MHFRAIHIEGVDGDQIGNDQSPRDFLSGLERVGSPFDVDEDLSSPTDPSLARVSIPRIKPGMSASGRPPGAVRLDHDRTRLVAASGSYCALISS
jgi:hypothetical protein